VRDEVAGVVVVGVDEFDGELFAGVGEGAEVAVVADSHVLGVGLAVLAPVAAGVVELLDLVVGAVAGEVAVGLLAQHVAVLVGVAAPPVLVVVEVEAHLALVLLCVAQILPFRTHAFVLNSDRSNRKNSPCPKCTSSAWWASPHASPIPHS
jgi:hypothetical protein